ncbi:hypothetical protein QFC22_000663 [Naganishia vaughanmartiniae]|uniref:Uncharacterized protein n=1 Tax=Naganishia vaughanmartiniae TaxID=1424756 RepID=A0ACC2XJT4_9TREE|nr:hypothetical protein QFC22_000663 [Naganishia vaughanmartiniae]
MPALLTSLPVSPLLKLPSQRMQKVTQTITYLRDSWATQGKLTFATIPKLNEEGQRINIVAGVDIPVAVPRNPLERAQLVLACREEILQDLVQDILLENGVTQYHVTGHDLHQVQIEEAIANHGRVSGGPYLLSTNIYRHDWHPGTGDCTYSLNIQTGPPGGSAENLEEHYTCQGWAKA